MCSYCGRSTPGGGWSSCDGHCHEVAWRPWPSTSLASTVPIGELAAVVRRLATQEMPADPRVGTLDPVLV
jgi:hypothetical protein